MIVREENDKFILTRQNDHAHLSGDIAQQFKHFFIQDYRFGDALFAIREHDRSWILPDAAPKWNLEKQRPFDFIDYPLQDKLDYYRLGLDTTENLNPYAGLLCSMHYTSFIHMDNADKKSKNFLTVEYKRQQQLRNTLEIIDERLLNKHFQLLQLCDNLSLYICLNHPGTNKVEEHYFFKNGFKNSSTFNPVDQNNLNAKWPTKNEVNIIPFPFEDSFKVSIDQIHLYKDEIQKNGLESSYLHGHLKKLSLRFLRDNEKGD